MQWWEYVVVGLILVFCLGVLVVNILKKRKGKGCCGDCSSCPYCSKTATKQKDSL